MPLDGMETTLRLIFGPVIKMLPVQAGALPDSQPPTLGTEPLSVVSCIWGGSRTESSVKRDRSDELGKLSFLFGLRLSLLARFWRLIDQGRSAVVFLALIDKGQPRAGHIEKGTFALRIVGLLSKPNALSRMRPILSCV
jgi:hypothetical protein